MDDWKYYRVTAEITWMDGGDSCDATIIMKLHAKSAGHAISRAKDRLEEIGSHDVEDVSAKEERI